MGRLDHTGERDGWRCWLCDEPVDPAPIVPLVDRLQRKGGREVVARCPSPSDATEAGAWLVDRLSCLAPSLGVTTSVEPGGGQFVLVLSTR